MNLLQWVIGWIKTNASSTQRRVAFIPNTSELPNLWQQSSEWRACPNLGLLEHAPSKALMQLCDSYWDSYITDEQEEEEIECRMFRDDRVYRRALELLALSNEEEVVKWTRARLMHQDYFAREDAARLIGQLAERNVLGEYKDAIADDLASLAVRPWKEDTKEVQANATALYALRFIGGPRFRAAVTEIIQSPNWNFDDLQSHAAELLGELVHRPFAESEDIVQAAKHWLQANS